ncbi:hypothetical protein [Terasakiella brassicae]|nr:hypothetical protein [Terasakiella brassicae]
MKVPVFLSYPKPHQKAQNQFIQKLKKKLKNLGLEPMTLGDSDYDMEAPLVGIRRLMNQSCGLINVSFKRSKIHSGTFKCDADINNNDAQPIKDIWLSSPYSQIEPAMAFQLGLPVLIIREKDVLADGVLEKGVLGIYMPEVDLSKDMKEYFKSKEWQQLINQWAGKVRQVWETNGHPAKKFT